MSHSEGIMWGRLIGLLQDMGMPTVILAALVIAVLAGYALAMLRAILKEIRDLKMEIREVRAQAQVDRKAAEDRARGDREVNKADHDRLFTAVADLQADVRVLRNRFDRSDG